MRGASGRISLYFSLFPSSISIRLFTFSLGGFLSSLLGDVGKDIDLDP
jgi:hypothetical protein